MSEAKIWRVLLSVAALGASLFLVCRVWNVLIPFLLGLTIAYLVYPLVDRFAAMGLRQDRIVIVLYLALLGVFVLVAIFVFPILAHETNAVLKDLPSFAQTVNGAIDQLSLYLQKTFRFILGKKAETLVIPFRVDKFVNSLILALPANILNVAHLGVWVLIIPFVSFFALSQGRRIIDAVYQWTPSEYVESLLGLLAEINATLGGYIRGQMLDALCVGLVTTVGLWLLGIDGAIFLGTITGFLNVVPFLAPLLGGSLALMVGLFQSQPAPVLFGIFLLYLSVRLLDDFLFVPLIVGHSVQLHPVFMLFAVLAGYEVGGFLGLVFAIPAAAIIKVVLGVFLRGNQENEFLKPPPLAL